MFSGNLAYVPPTGPAPLPVVSVPTALSVVEGGTVNVTINKGGSGACSAWVRSKAVSATLGQDYQGIEPQMVSFAANETTKTVSLVTLADTAAEANEQVQILIYDPVGCTLGTSTCTVTIEDKATVTIPDAVTIYEGTPQALTLTKFGSGACSVTVRSDAPAGSTSTHENEVVAEILGIFAGYVPTSTIWVSTTGSDTTGTGSSSAPYKTIAKGVGAASPGTRVVVKAGTYTGSVNLGSVYGTATKPILIESETPLGAIIVGDSTSFGLQLYKFNYVKISGFDIRCNYIGTGDFGGCKMHGSVSTPSSHLYFTGNKISGKGQDGFKLFAGSKRCLVIGNTINGTWTAESIDFVQVEDTVVAYNTVSDTHGTTTMTMKAGTRNIEVVGNLFAGTGSGCRIGGSGSSRCDRNFPSYWTGDADIPKGYEAYKVTFHHNRVEASGNTSITFMGAVQCSATNNYFSRNIAVTQWVYQCPVQSDGSPGMLIDHKSSSNTITNNVFASAPDIDVDSGNGTNTTTTPNTQGTTKPDAGNVASLITAYLGGTTTTPTGQATPGTDYTAIAPTVISFAANETTKTVTLSAVADTITDPDETFRVLLSDAVGCSILNAACTVTIKEGAPPVEEPPPTNAIYTRADGFASAAACGTGYPIHRVTNLNNSGAGSLREGVDKGDVMIVFEVAGRIALTSDLVFKSNTTIAGETAPAPGITIAKKEFKIQASNVRISHVTFEKGYAADNLGNSDCGKIAPGTSSGSGPNGKFNGTPTVTSNVHFYHCCFLWAMDEIVEHWPSLSRRIDGISYHDCIFAETLYLPRSYDSSLSNHAKVKPSSGATQDNHNYGVILGYNTRRVDIQNCLFQEFVWRCPWIDHSTSVVLGNNISNNCRNGATIQHNRDARRASTDTATKPLPNDCVFQVTVRGYLAISGPDTGAGPYGGFRIHAYVNPLPDNSAIYVSNLYGWKGGASSSTYITPDDEIIYSKSDKPYWNDGTTKRDVVVTTIPINTPTAIKPLSADEIYNRALQNIGPRPKERAAGSTLPFNPNVARTVKRLKDKTGKFVNHELEVGGFYNPTKVDRKLDANTTFPDGTKPAHRRHSRSHPRRPAARPWRPGWRSSARRSNTTRSRSGRRRSRTMPHGCSTPKRLSQSPGAQPRPRRDPAEVASPLPGPHARHPPPAGAAGGRCGRQAPQRAASRHQRQEWAWPA